LFFNGIKIDKMVQFSRNVMKAFFIFIFLLIGINGCKDDYTSVIPYVYVEFSINPYTEIDLNIPGGSIYIPKQGYGGIIVFHDFVESSNPFLAFDAACTHEVVPSIRVIADGSGIATCTDCKSQFMLFGGSGSVNKPPAIEPLKQYHTYFSGGRIVIKN
jgi:nitrite reductase/ring-hydroxylating ferredoxin subunit